MKKYTIFASAIVCVFCSCSAQKSAPPTASDPNISAPTVTRHDIASFVEATGDLSPTNLVTIKAEVSGRLRKLHVITGQQVKEGDLLVSLDDTDLKTERETAQTAIDGAKLSLEKSQRAFDRTKELFDQKARSKEEFDNASTDLELAKNGSQRAYKSLQTVEDKLKKIFIRSPVDGAVLEIEPAEGEIVTGVNGFSAGTRIMDIADLNSMRVLTIINQVDVLQLHTGQAAEIIVEAADRLKLQGEVTFIAPTTTTKGNPESRGGAAGSVKGFKVNIRIINPDPRARPGMTTRVRIKTAESKNALAVSLAAIFTEGDKKFVYVKTSAAPEKREVKVGLADLNYAEILSGLKEGDTLLLEKPPGTKQKG